MSVLVPDEKLLSLDDNVSRADTFYETRLKHTLEPTENGKAIAIHPDSGDYVIAETTGDAMRKMLLKHPQGGMLIRFIGPVSLEEGRRAAHLKLSGSQPL